MWLSSKVSVGYNQTFEIRVARGKQIFGGDERESGCIEANFLYFK